MTPSNRRLRKVLIPAGEILKNERMRRKDPSSFGRVFFSIF